MCVVLSPAVRQLAVLSLVAGVVVAVVAVRLACDQSKSLLQHHMPTLQFHTLQLCHFSFHLVIETASSLCMYGGLCGFVSRDFRVSISFWYISGVCSRSC